MRFPALLALAATALAAPPAPAPEQKNEPPDVFATPRVAAGFARVAGAMQALFRERRYADAEKLLTEAARQEPSLGVHHYNLACALALQGKADAALDSLATAIDRGHAQPVEMAADEDFASLRENARFKSLVETARMKAAEPPKFSPLQAKLIADGIARVEADNTAWNQQTGLLMTAFRFDENDTRKSAEAVKGEARAGELVREWQREGKAAGLLGVLYDNHDRGHSSLPVAEFPQLTRIEYGEAAKREALDHGSQTAFFFNQPVLGNSSTALTNGAFWRSQTRSAQTSARAIAVQSLHYLANQLYFYPEHRDHDPGHNGQKTDAGDGYGDVFPANTPYVVTSQGSSGSDQPFLRAFATALAALRPDTRAALVKAGALAPTLQMICRRSLRGIETDEDFLSGKAHPVVLDAARLDPERMVRLAQSLTPTDAPLVVRIKLDTADVVKPGIDFFDPASGEGLFDTPCAIARIFRASARERRLIVSAEALRGSEKGAATFRWVLLQGRPELVKIATQKPDGSQAELRVQWHGRFSSAGDPKIDTNRVDIAVFAHNGTHWSAPAIVSIYCPDDQSREYDDAGRIRSIEYRSQAAGGNYTDPGVHVPRDWRDEYRYDDAGRLTGWTRWRGEKNEAFTAHGHLILEKDSLGRATKAQPLRYGAKLTQPGGNPSLDTAPLGDPVGYTYASDADLVGQPAAPPAK